MRIHTACPQTLHKSLFSNAPGSTAFSQEQLKTITYAKFGGQTERIMRDSKIVSNIKLWMHLGNLECNEEARVAVDYASDTS